MLTPCSYKIMVQVRGPDKRRRDSLTLQLRAILMAGFHPPTNPAGIEELAEATYVHIRHLMQRWPLPLPDNCQLAGVAVTYYESPNARGQVILMVDCFRAQATFPI